MITPTERQALHGRWQNLCRGAIAWQRHNFPKGRGCTELKRDYVFGKYAIRLTTPTNERKHRIKVNLLELENSQPSDLGECEFHPVQLRHLEVSLCPLTSLTI